MLKIKGTNCNKTLNLDLRQTDGSREGNYVWSIQGRLDLASCPEAADLLDIGKSIHLADRAVPRSRGSSSRFRRIEITLPVRETSFWKRHAGDFEEALEFTTGDAWTIHFTSFKEKAATPKRKAAPRGPMVALFSGGLDSLCGVAYLAKSNTEAIYVSHCPPGYESNRELICEVYEALGKAAPEKNRFISFRLNVTQRHWKTGATMFQEMSRRTRPVFFLSLASAVALVHDSPKIQMSENGALAFSLPNRFDTHGPAISRQAHSCTINFFSKLLSQLAGDSKRIVVENPFTNMTKGDACRLLGASGKLAAKSMSCEYVGHQKADLLRWIQDHPASARKRKLGNGPQCGLCYPCLVRRAALKSAGISDPAGDYFADAPTILDRTHSERTAIDLFSDRIKPPLLDTLAPNPLYHQRFCENLLEMNLEQFAIRYFPQLRSLSISGKERSAALAAAHKLIRRFATEQLQFLHDAVK